MKNLEYLDAGTTAGSAGTGKGEDCDLDAHAYLRSIYQDRLQPTQVRMRAAMQALEVEKPKLKATAIGRYDGDDFASLLEKAILRSEGKPVSEGKLIEGSPIHDPSELAKPPLSQLAT